MSWAIGYDDHWQRDIGYGVPAFCDHPGCHEKIDRGLAHVCGDQPYGGAHGCGLYFCGEHHGGPHSMCEQCASCVPPFPPKGDHGDWIRFKLIDESWCKWRLKNPNAVAELFASYRPAHFVRMVKPRFAKLVESGLKRQTVRPVPVRMPITGDMLSLRMWVGKPYRTKHRVLLETLVKEVKRVLIADEGIIESPQGRLVFDRTFSESFARADGFEDWNEMREWFRAEHGMPFQGIVIYW